MPPQIIDLVSDDDEDLGAPSSSTARREITDLGSSHGTTPGGGGGSSSSSRQNVTNTSRGSQRETIDPATLTWNTYGNAHNRHRDKSRSSTISSHTERGSPSEEPARPTTARRENGKGKQREVEIPEIDLSRVDSDMDDYDGNSGGGGEKGLSGHGDGGVVLCCDNGELSEEEALRRAIALSLQDQTPRRKSNEDGGAGANTSSTPSAGKAKAKVKSPAGPLVDVGGSARRRRADEPMPEAPDNRVISLSPSPTRRLPQYSHTTTRGPLLSPGSTPTPPSPPPASTEDQAHLSPTTTDAQDVSSAGPSAGPGTFSLANLDRRRMEAERLARRKRKLEEEESQDGAAQRGGEGRSSKAVKLSQPATATRTGAGIGEAPSTQQNPTHDLHGHSDGSGHRLQLPERNNRATAQAADGSSKTGQRAGGAAGSASSGVKAGISATGNRKDKSSDVVSPPTNSTASNPTPVNPPCIQIDDDDAGDGHDNNTRTTRKDTTAAAASSSFNGNNSAANLYHDGITLKTYAAGHPSAGTITFERVVSPSSQLESCLLSSFIWNLDWLLPHFETRRTKFQLVMQAKDAAERQAVERDFQGVPNVRLTFPPMGGNVSCMHSKLMLLFYKDEEQGREQTKNTTAAVASAMGKKGPVDSGGQECGSQRRRCRIVVPTANLVNFDWGVGGFMENTVWLIDLPAKSASDAANSSSWHGATTSAALPPAADCQTLFEKSLKEFLRAQTVPDDVVRKLDLFDFRKTERYGFVHSIGGMHGGQAWQATGLCGLGATITALGLASRGPIHMDYVSSSIGSLNDEFLRSIHLAASGDNGLTEYNRRVDKRGPVKQGSWKENFRLYFPSDNTVRTSKGGPRNAGTICFSLAWWNNPKFPRSNMYDCVSVREGLLMHNKLLFVRYASPVEKSQSGNIGWVYVGSANLSESAWGRLVQDRTTKKPRLNCRNWECGVIIPIPATRGSSGIFTVMDRGSAGLAAFNRIVPVPMRLPSENLESKKPWTFSE
ncbi:uncharacterized protein PV07_01863 [Cladophialophora immunda]|uniref:PLD phosphodiesterase domain-containing protein n=1 Tax=Cladophialophora immunda TaxID=569365 RepID=A0A0D2CVL5_9EURO|nr:uncharacterized protein PV07_01863 [Cladophialophora immunda]KIW35148.1 hypothetical protein PV07_01863 [Cladophialophora immunda]